MNNKSFKIQQTIDICEYQFHMALLILFQSHFSLQFSIKIKIICLIIVTKTSNLLLEIT